MAPTPAPRRAPRIAPRIEDAPTRPGHADELQRLQSTVGNRGMQQLLGGVRALIGQGMPLPDALRAETQARFGAEFSSVRLHDHAGAHALAQDQQARAFTLGQDIVFNKGCYGASTSEGRRLLGHELAHVVQQQGRGSMQAFAPAGRTHETAADSAGQALAGNGSGLIAAGPAAAHGIQREPLAAADFVARTPDRHTAPGSAQDVAGTPDAAATKLESPDTKQAPMTLRLKIGEAIWVRTVETRASMLDALWNARSRLYSEVRGGLDAASHSETSFVAFLSEGAGFTSAPDTEIWDPALGALERASAALRAAHISQACEQLQAAATRISEANARISGHREDSISGAHRVQVSLEFIKDAADSAGAAIAEVLVPEGGGVAYGALVGAAENYAGQGTEVLLDMRTEIDHVGIAFDTTLNALLGLVGMKLNLGQRFAAPATAPALRKFLTWALTNVGQSRAFAVLGITLRSAFDDLRKGRDIDREAIIKAVWDAISDPKAYAFDFLNAGVGSATSKVADRLNLQERALAQKSAGPSSRMEATARKGSGQEQETAPQPGATISSRAAEPSAVVDHEALVLRPEDIVTMGPANPVAVSNDATRPQFNWEHLGGTSAAKVVAKLGEPVFNSQDPRGAARTEPGKTRPIGDVTTRNDIPLTDAQFQEAKALAVEMGMPADQIHRAHGDTSYHPGYDALLLGPDLHPRAPADRASGLANPANAALEWRAVIGHELAHREAALGGQTRDDVWHEEPQASVRAALHTPDLSNEQARQLLQDAAARRRFQTREGEIYVDVERYGPAAGASSSEPARVPSESPQTGRSISARYISDPQLKSSVTAASDQEPLIIEPTSHARVEEGDHPRTRIQSTASAMADFHKVQQDAWIASGQVPEVSGPGTKGTREVTREEQLFGIRDPLNWRAGSPSVIQRRQAQAALPEGAFDPALPGQKMSEPAQADHIESANEIRKRPGFAMLSESGQRLVLNTPQNIYPVSGVVNGARGDTPYRDWDGRLPDGRIVDANWLADMRLRAAKAADAISANIERQLQREMQELHDRRQLHPRSE